MINFGETCPQYPPSTLNYFGEPFYSPSYVEIDERLRHIGYISLLDYSGRGHAGQIGRRLGGLADDESHGVVAGVGKRYIEMGDAQPFGFFFGFSVKRYQRLAVER